MRQKTAILILGLIIFTTGCTKPESTNDSVITVETITKAEIETIDALETVEIADNEKEGATSEQQFISEEQSINEDVQDYSALDKSNITLNPDGTYTYTEEYIGAISSYSYFEGATSEEINKFLQDWGYLFIDLAGAEANDVMSLFEGGNLHKENETIRQSEGITQSNQSQSTQNQPSTTVENNPNNENQNNSSSGNNNSSQSNNSPVESNSQPVESSGITPEGDTGSSANWNLGDAFAGADTTPIGGGERIHTGATVTTP